MSGDMMSFPDNWWTFVQQYQFFDKDEVYTNGSLLISVFRVKQMVQHYFGRTCYIEFPYFGDAPVINGQPRCSECKASFAVGMFPNYCPNCGARVTKSDQDLVQEVDE